MRVLYVNHTGLVAGAEHSLLTLLGALPDEVDAAVACGGGPLERAVGELGIPVHRLRGTAGSLKLHPRHTTRAVVELTRDALAVRSIARRLGADVLHANSIRAGLVTTLASRLGAPPSVVHVRERLPRGPA